MLSGWGPVMTVPALDRVWRRPGVLEDGRVSPAPGRASTCRLPACLASLEQGLWACVTAWVRGRVAGWQGCPALAPGQQLRATRARLGMVAGPVREPSSWQGLGQVRGGEQASHAAAVLGLWPAAAAQCAAPPGCSILQAGSLGHLKTCRCPASGQRCCPPRRPAR